MEKLKKNYMVELNANELSDINGGWFFFGMSSFKWGLGLGIGAGAAGAAAYLSA